MREEVLDGPNNRPAPFRVLIVGTPIPLLPQFTNFRLVSV